MAGAVLNIGLNYVCIKMFGFIAAAYTTLVCYVLFTFGHYLYMNYSVRKIVKQKYVFQPVRLMILSIGIIAAGLVVVVLYDHPIIRYLLIAISAIILYIKRNTIISILKSVKKKKAPTNGST